MTTVFIAVTCIALVCVGIALVGLYMQGRIIEGMVGDVVRQIDRVEIALERRKPGPKPKKATVTKIADVA